MLEKCHTMRQRITEVEQQLESERGNVNRMNLDNRVDRIVERHENQENIQNSINNMTEALPQLIITGGPGSGPTRIRQSVQTTTNDAQPSFGQMIPLIMGAGRIEVNICVLKNSDC